MKLYYKENGITLIRGDCLEVMDKLINKNIKFDAIITDPPYGTTQCKWDSVIPLDEMWKRLNLLKNNTVPVVLFASQPFTSLLVSSNISNFKYDWVWKKPKGTGHLNAKKQPMRDKEDIIVFYEKQCMYNPQWSWGEPYSNLKSGKTAKKSEAEVSGKYMNGAEYRNGSDGRRYPKQILEFGVVERGTVHPTQKPIDLMEYLIKTYTKEGDSILDFTCGSGTTLIAAKNTNRKAVGIELEEKYCEISKNRLEENNNKIITNQ